MEKSQLHVLFIDDDEDDYVLTRDLLDEAARDKYELEWVSDYETALTRLEAGVHDVCLLDFRLGERDGLEFLDAAIERDYDTPLIFLTGRGNYEIDIEAMHRGAADYLVKSQIDAAMLERAIRYAIERKKAESALEWEANVNAVTAELSRALISTVSLEDMSILVLEHAKKLTNSQFGYVGYIEPQTGYLVCPTMTRDVWNICHVEGKNNVFKDFGGLWGWVLHNRQSLMTNAPAQDHRSTGTPDGHIPIHNFLSAPALIDNKLVGQIALANSRRDYTAKSLVLIERMASLYALAIQRHWAEETLQRKTHELNERIKELNCLYNISRLTEREGVPLEKTLQGIVEFIPFAWQFPQDTCARVVVNEQEFKTNNFTPTARKLSSELMVYGQIVGSLEVCYLKEKPPADYGSFLPQERELLDAVAERISRIVERKWAEESLKASEAKYRRLIEENIDGIVILDRDGSILFANHAAEAIFARDLSELTGGVLGIPAMETEAARVEIIQPNRQIRVAEVRVAETRWEGQEAHLATLRDVTEQERIELARIKSEKRYRSLVENAPLGIISIDTTGKIMEINQKIAEILGSPSIEATHAINVLTFPPLVERGIAADFVHCIETGELVVRDRRYISKWGKDLYLRYHLTPIRGKDQQIIGVQGIVEDFTARKQAEQELARSNAELQQFANILSHDLQAPLRTVSSFAQLLARQYKNELDEDANEFIDYITSGAKRMSELISDLLIYSRVDSKGKELEPVDSTDILARTLGSLRIMLEDSDAELTYDALPMVMADAAQLGQLFQNLVSNALKFRGAEAPRVHISAEKDNGMWRFSVRDNGIGIPPEHLEDIFVLFRRLHTPEEYPGTGLGLSLCRKIVTRHGGHIWAKSAPGEGTTFYFTIPGIDQPIKDQEH